jgi:putative transcriptional regulator
MSCPLTNRLAEYRTARKLKKSQLAHYLGKSRAYVTRLERGDIQPRLEVALRIARRLHKPVEEIFQLPDAICPSASETNSQSNFPAVPPSAAGNKPSKTAKP